MRTIYVDLPPDAAAFLESCVSRLVRCGMPDRNSALVGLLTSGMVAYEQISDAILIHQIESIKKIVDKAGPDAPSIQSAVTRGVEALEKLRPPDVSMHEASDKAIEIFERDVIGKK